MTTDALALMSSAASSAVPSTLSSLTSRLSFAALLDQRGRMLKVETALPSLALVPERMVLKDALGQPFDLVLDCVSTSAHFELKQLIGEQISVRLLQASGSYKPFHGYVVNAGQLGSDGGLARYRLHMRPWLSFLAQRRDSFIFQDQTALDIIEAVFKDHPQAHYRIEVTQTLRTRSLCTQYRESDLEFITRLLAEEGLSYRVEHLDGEAAKSATQQGKDNVKARHVLVITDAEATRPDLGQTRFTSRQVASDKDCITAFMAARQAAPNVVTLGAWDYKQVAGTAGTDTSALAFGELPALEVYDGSGAYRYQSAAHAQRAASLALAALELGFKTFEGQGSARDFEAGRSFSLIDHPLYGANTTAFNYAGAITASRARADNAFTILAVEHHATNNLGAQAAQLLGLTDLEQGTYINHFHCAPAAAPVVPRFIRKPTASGLQTALVVGIQGEPLTTDREHRVKVQFAWQRGEKPNAGGTAHESSADKKGNAPGDERSGTWVRVGLPAAGANWGASFVPRLGTEVAIDYIEADIDRPVVVAQLYNGVDTPPFSAGVDSGINHPGVISGVHTHALDGETFNQWAVDDASGQMRMRLLAGYTAAEIGLGHLIQQSASSAQRGSWRGSGFEATTQGWASVRAGKGLLISTTARAGSYGSAQSTQMDAQEALAQLRAATDLGQRLSQAATSATAQPLSAFEPNKSATKLIDQIDPKKDAKHPASVNGQEAKKAAAGSRTGSDPVEAFTSPVIALDTPSTAIFATEAGMAAFSGQDSSLAVQSDAHQTAAHTWASVSGKTSSWYVHEGGIKAFAANGPVSLRAHTDALQIWADKEVTVISVNDEIRISAQSKIELIAGKSAITLEGSNIEFKTPGAFTVKGSSHAFLGGGGQAAALTPLPAGQVTLQPPKNSLMVKFDEQVVFKDKSGVVVEGHLRYAITNKAQPDQTLQGISPAKGETARIDTPSAQPLEHALDFDNFAYQVKNSPHKTPHR
jgi:type VI secretion system secreted protein VgrG